MQHRFHFIYRDRIKLIGKKRPYDNKPASSESETVRIQKIMSYPQLSSVLTLPKEQIKLKLKRKNPYYFLMLGKALISQVSINNLKFAN